MHLECLPLNHGEVVILVVTEEGTKVIAMHPENESSVTRIENMVADFAAKVVSKRTMFERS